MTTTARPRQSPPHRKTAISVPARLLAQVDAAARSRGESRSRFIQRLLQEGVRASRDATLRRRIDALFADPGLAKEQRGGARALETAHGWTDERW